MADSVIGTRDPASPYVVTRDVLSNHVSAGVERTAIPVSIGHVGTRTLLTVAPIAANPTGVP